MWKLLIMLEMGLCEAYFFTKPLTTRTLFQQDFYSTTAVFGVTKRCTTSLPNAVFLKGRKHPGKA